MWTVSNKCLVTPRVPPNTSENPLKRCFLKCLKGTPDEAKLDKLSRTNHNMYGDLPL
jgi:hypothetical protein